MYSKKINQLATNLNPQNDDLLPIGDAETGQLKTTTFGSVSGITGDGVISGGIVTWTGTGLIFDISACTYILNGVRYTSPFTTKTLAAADPTNPRIDVFAVNTSGQVEVIQGTPNANPVEPEGDTPTTLGLTNVTINAGATTPNGVTKDMIYDENVETWTKTQSVTGSFDYNNTAFAYTGTKSLLVTMSAGFANFTFSKAVAMDISNYKSLSFAIRLNTAWTSNTILTVRFQNGTNNVTNLFQINSTNNVGFNRNLAGQWQLITIPFNNTNLRFTNNAFTAIRIGTQNAAATYRLDTISLNGGINNPGGGTTTPSNSFGFVNGTTGTASSTTATDTLNVVGSGLITTSATGKTLTIASNQIATGSILGRVTAGTGNIETLTGTQATTLLDEFTSSLKGLAPASGGGTTNFLRADGTWAAAGGSMAIGGSITSATQNSILFAGASGVLAQNNSQFFWNNTDTSLNIVNTSATSNRGIIVSQINDGIQAAAMQFQKARGTIASPTNVSALDIVSAFTFNARVGGAYTSDRSLFGANMASSTGIGMYFIASSANGTYTPAIYIHPTSNVVVGSTQSILTGITDSGYKLDVNGTARVSGNLNVGGSASATGSINSGTSISVGTSAGTSSYGVFSQASRSALYLGSMQGANAPAAHLVFGADSLGTPFVFKGGISATLTGGTEYFRISISGISVNNSNPFFDVNYKGLNIGAGTSGSQIQLCKSDGTRIGTILAESATNALAIYTLFNGNVTLGANSQINYCNFATSGNIQIKNGGTFTDVSSAIFSVTSTTKGFLPPRMTTTEKNAIASPAAGLIVYDTTLNKLCVRTASAWETITSL